MPKVKRLALLKKHMKYGPMFVEVPFEPVFDLADVQSNLEKHLAAGFEGSVLHDLTAVYRPQVDKAENRTLAWIKVKEWLSSEFTVIGFIAGTGKHRGRLGAFLVEGEVDGVTVKSEVGTGMTNELRQDMWDNQSKWKGALVEIKYFRVTKDLSLLFPSMLRRREDLE